MSKNVSRNAFVVYPSMLDALRVLPEKDANQLLMAIIDFGITGEYQVENPALELVLLPIIEGIKTQKRRYRNIKVLNLIIDDFYRRTAGTADKDKVFKSDRIRRSLQKMVVDCQREDITLGTIVQRISLLIQNPDVRLLLSYGHANSVIWPEESEFVTSRLWTSILKAAEAERQKQEVAENV